MIAALLSELVGSGSSLIAVAVVCLVGWLLYAGLQPHELKQERIVRTSPLPGCSRSMKAHHADEEVGKRSPPLLVMKSEVHPMLSHFAIKTDQKRSTTVVPRLPLERLNRSGNAEDTPLRRTTVAVPQDDITPRPQQQLYAPAEGPTALRNIGNTCYMNAVLQCLFSGGSGLFCSALAAAGGRRGVVGDEQSRPLLSSTLGLLSQMSRSGKKNMPSDAQVAKALEAFKSAVARYKPQFQGSDENDAHEFLLSFLELLHRELTAKERDGSSFSLELEPELDCSNCSSDVYTHFGGEVRQVLTCLECTARSTRTDPFLCLSVSCGSHSADSTAAAASNVAGRLAALETTEILLRQTPCEKCRRTQSRQEIESFVSRWPTELIVHLKRFDSSGTKITTPVEVSPILNLVDAAHQGQDGVAMKKECMYRLRAVVCHRGSARRYSAGGHYVAYVVTERGSCFLCNDFEVREASLTEMLDAATRDGYLLFFSKSR